jgi:hypothetical protein
MELEPSTTPFSPPEDSRPRMPPPLPVQLVAIADVTLPAVAGLETEFDAFYIGLLRLERQFDASHDGRLLVYRAENFNLRLVIHEVPPPREDYRPLGMVVPSLTELAQRLDEAQVPFLRQRGLFAGCEYLVLVDPAGNFIEVAGARLAT